MRRLSLPGLIIFAATLFCGVVYSSNSTTSNQYSSIEKPSTWNGGSSVIEQWFFVVPAGNKQKGFEKKAQDLIVHSGEDFGIGVRFTSIKPNPKIKIQIKLVVPSSPENFPCRTCKPGELTISKDGHTIIINEEVAESLGQTAFYWGIAASDPRGKYQMSLSFDGVQIEAYDFEVK